MVLVEKDDDIKWFNSSLLAKMKEYNIVLPHLKDLKMLDLNNLQKVESNIATDLNYKGWFDDTIACWDVSQGCQGCNNRQFDYTLCNAGCFGTNTGCVECVNGEGSGISCQGCNSTDEACDTCNTGCEGCDDGCFGSCNSCNICDTDCFGCNVGCQGTQTCTDCNTGEGCVSGCQGDVVAGCELCNDDYDDCVHGYKPACNKSQAVFGCKSCDTACQGEDICSGYSACSTCVSCDSGNTCITGNQYIENGGCTNDNKGGCFLFDNVDCLKEYSHNEDGAVTCLSMYREDGVECPRGYKTNGTERSCHLNFESGGIKCSSDYSSDGYCKSGYTDGVVDCRGEYDSFIRTGEGTGSSCKAVFSDANTECRFKYTTVGRTEECSLDYTGEQGSCHAGFKSDGEGKVECLSSFIDGGTECESGFSMKGGVKVCIRGFTDGEIECQSDYNNTCSACNTTSDNVCIDCNNGEAAECTECVGTGDTANCSECVAGVPTSCTECVDGDGGCEDCQGCDSGCNKDVSCSGYTVTENGDDLCVGQFTDTTCNQTCIGGYDSSVNCLSGQGCEGCDTCQGCDSCQGCNTVQAGCGTCDHCDACDSCQDCNTCQSCDGGLGCYSGSFKHECPGEYAVCGEDTCSGGCHGAQGECQQVAQQ